MSLPGPPFGIWAPGLVVIASAFVILGEALRRPLARFSSLLASERPIERILVDLFLGGGAIYLIALVPLGLFYPATLPLAVAVGAVSLAVGVLIDRRAGRGMPDPKRFLRALLHRFPLLALAAAGGLYLLEMSVATQAPTGNTFDSSVLGYFVAKLVAQHSIAFSYAPVAPLGIAYPQGTTAWLGSCQVAFGLPPARTSILVTPLFLALAPLGAYVAGERLLGTASAGAIFAGIFTLIATWTRVQVAGSNDFVLSFPLVLLLIGWSGRWMGSQLPRWGDSIAFGGMSGILASLSPVGAYWILLLLVPLGLLSRPLGRTWALGWVARWSSAAALGVAFVGPSLVVALQGVGHAGLSPGALSVPSNGSVGISAAQFLGLTDPYLFRPNDVWLSPFFLVRDELAILLTVGIFLVALPALYPGPSESPRAFQRLTVSGAISAFVILFAAVGANAGMPLLAGASAFTSPSETSELLFTVYVMIAAVPIVVFGRLRELPLRARTRILPDLPRPRPPTLRTSPRGTSALFWVAFGLLMLPGALSTAAILPGYEASLYTRFGNVTSGDFDLLQWASDHLPAGARVLVAPGSAAEFLPGYVPSALILYPMTADGIRVNRSYELLVTELTNGTLDSTGQTAMRDLSVGYIAVTGPNTHLYLPFSPVPLQNAPGLSVAFHEGDAYVFARAGS